MTDRDWTCGCHQTNPDCEDRCCNCGEERYRAEGEEAEAEALSNLYNDETNRMIEAQRLK